MGSDIRKLGELPPTLQGIALDLKINEVVAIATDEHRSAAHGEHFDIYMMRRLDEQSVIMWKWHSDDIDKMDSAQKKLVDQFVYHPLTGDDTKGFRPGTVGGC